MIPGWKEEIETEYLGFLMEQRRATPAEVAARLGVSEGWAVYWLTELAREGRVRILGVEPVGDRETQVEGEPLQRSDLRGSRPAPNPDRVLREAA